MIVLYALRMGWTDLARLVTGTLIDVAEHLLRLLLHRQ
jgi:hypothetical protein